MTKSSDNTVRGHLDPSSSSAIRIQGASGQHLTCTFCWLLDGNRTLILLSRGGITLPLHRSLECEHTQLCQQNRSRLGLIQGYKETLSTAQDSGWNPLLHEGVLLYKKQGEVSVIFQKSLDEELFLLMPLFYPVAQWLTHLFLVCERPSFKFSSPFPFWCSEIHLPLSIASALIIRLCSIMRWTNSTHLVEAVLLCPSEYLNYSTQCGIAWKGGTKTVPSSIYQQPGS